MSDNMIDKTDQYEILIVDDTRENLELPTRILRERGYRVRPTPSGNHALQSVAVKPPDLILLDIKMPEIDGYEVCRRLKSEERSRNVPVIFISAHGDDAKKIEGFKAGGIDYIAKPFRREEVLARVETQLRLHELTERLEQQVDRRTRHLKQQIAELERTREALKESERRYKSLIENMEISLVLIGPDHRIISVNAALGRPVDKPVDDIVGGECFRELEKREAVCPHCPGVKSLEAARPREVKCKQLDMGDTIGEERLPLKGSTFFIRLESPAVP